MVIYETIIGIISKGADEYEAGEKAGEVINGEKVARNMTISCESTHAVFAEGKKGFGFINKQEKTEKYETVIHIYSEGESEDQARESAGELIDISKMDECMVISYGPTFPRFRKGARDEIQNGDRIDV
ncbi:MAG: hypothetical protein GF409_07970 [Candidatus Omnitrophica bacterium]|nr:hypothetical protein [Candidatus Omnitrophota bacterium]